MPARQTSRPEAPTPSRARGATSRSPVTRPDSVARTALVNRLRASGSPLVTVTAPAGYGKTTLLAQWADRDGRPFAWVRVDEDNDPRVLLRDIAVALGDRSLDTFRAGRVASTTQRSTNAIRRLAAALFPAERPIVVVLDDAHLLRSRGSLAVVAALAEHVPAGSTLVLAGRSVRLAVARARAAGRLFELDAGDLALTRREEELLLREAGIAVAPADHLALSRRMEGWAAGTYLGALALREGTPGAGSGEDRFVADYFEFECTGALSPRDVRFLTRTAVLDRLSGSLCDHVLDTGDAAVRLETLARANLFVLPLDRERGWYRYHRAFREYLLGELRLREPRLIRDLYRRAATWCEANGDVTAAAEYARAGGDLGQVARLVTSGGLTSSTTRSATGERWLGWFDDPERLRKHGGVVVLGTWAHLVHGRTAAARRWHDLALTAVGGTGARSADGELAAELAALRAARCTQGSEHMREDARAALAGLSSVSPWRPVALLLRGVAELLCDDPGAEATLHDAAEAAESARAPEIQVWALSELSVLASAHGDEARADELVLSARSLIDQRRLHGDPSSALAFAVAARLRLRRGETATARLDLEHAETLAPELTDALPWYTVQTALELARAELAFADPVAARRPLDRAAAVLRRRPRLGDLAGQADRLGEEVRSLVEHRDARTSGLTGAELRLLPLLTTHLSFREIAEELFVSRNTVKTQAISVYRKLNASSRSEAIARARDLGLVDPGSPRAEFTLSG